MKKELILKVGPLSFSAGGELLYSDVFVELYENEFVLLSGPSGSGKSSILRQIVGLTSSPPDTSRILLGRKYSSKEIFLFRSRVVLLLQNYPLIYGTVEENLKFPFELKNATVKYDLKKAVELLEKLDLTHLDFNRPVKDLSFGERQRLSLVRALLWDPDVILADEPFSGLDEDATKKSFRALYEFSKRAKKAVLVVSHKIPPFKVFRIWNLKNNTLVQK